MLSLQVPDDWYEELRVVFKHYGFDLTRYTIWEDPSTNCTQIQMYFQAYGTPYGLSYAYPQYVLREFSKLNIKLTLVDYIHKQLRAIDKTETWELVPKT